MNGTRTQAITTSLVLAAALTVTGATRSMASGGRPGPGALPPTPEGPCDICAAAGAPCVAAHSTTRALYGAYDGPLYRVMRQSDGGSLDIGVVRPVASPAAEPGGYANASAQDAFCANTYCWISVVYDQSPKHNDLVQAPRGGFSGPAMGGFNNLPIADLAPVTVMGHKVYGVFIAPGMGVRQNDARGTAVDDQAEPITVSNTPLTTTPTRSSSMRSSSCSPSCSNASIAFATSAEALTSPAPQSTSSEPCVSASLPTPIPADPDPSAAHSTSLTPVGNLPPEPHSRPPSTCPRPAQ